MDHERRPSPSRVPPACLLLAGVCLQGCLFSWGGRDAAGEEPRGTGEPYTFLYPTASSRLHLDSTYTVRWQASAAAGVDPVRLRLYRNDTLLGDVHGSLPASGDFAWDLAAARSLGGYATGSGSGYRLRIANASDTSRSAASPAFDLRSDRAGGLALLAPAQGAKVADSILRVAWTVFGDVGDSVGLQLYRGARRVADLGGPVRAAAGGYAWPVDTAAMPPGDGYRVRIFALSDPAIARMGPDFAYDTPFRSGAYAFIRPRAGDVWTAGESVELEWSVTGDPGETTAITLWRDAPREFVRGWTPIGTFETVRAFRAPSDLEDGTYRLRLASLADTALQAFSPAFAIRGGSPPRE